MRGIKDKWENLGGDPADKIKHDIVSDVELGKVDEIQRTICELFGPQGCDYAMHCNKENLEPCRASDNVFFPAR